MSSVSPLDWQLRPSRWQSWVLVAAAALGLGALFLLTAWSPWLWGLALIGVLALEGVHYRQRRAHLSGRFLIQADGFWRLPDADGLWQLTAVSWFPGLCQIELANASDLSQRRHVLIWRDQLDADTWRRLRVRLHPQPT